MCLQILFWTGKLFNLGLDFIPLTFARYPFTWSWIISEIRKLISDIWYPQTSIGVFIPTFNLRDGSGYQNGWIFGKIPNVFRLENYVANFFVKRSKKTYINVQNLQHKFLDLKCPFGSLTHPLNKFVTLSITQWISSLSNLRKPRFWERLKGFISNFQVTHMEKQIILPHTPIALPWMSMQTYLFVCKYRIILRIWSLS